MLAFERPWALSLIVLFPALALLARWRKSGGRSPFFPLADRRFPVPPLFLPLRIFVFCRRAALALAIVACVFAAAGPAIVDMRTLYLSRGNELTFVVDVSPSMASADFAPTRLEAAKLIIEDFLVARRNETVGLVAFGGEAALVCPPTMDYGALAARLRGLVPGLYGEGTAMGSGIATGIAHSARSLAPEKHIILLTDGENNAGAVDPETAAAAARFGISLSVIGIGSKGEVPLSYVDPWSSQKHSGKYMSGFDARALERLAQAGKGRYFAAEDKAELKASFAALSERSDALVRTRTETKAAGLAPFFLAIALAALALARVLGLLGAGGRP